MAKSLINSLKLGDNRFIFSLPYAICETASATASKVASTDVSNNNFILAEGVRVLVNFTNTNTASSPTLNINDTGAKSIYYRGALITASYLTKGILEFVYDGTQYNLIGNVDTNTNTSHNHTAGTGLIISGSGGTSGATSYSLATSGVTSGTYGNNIASTNTISPSSSVTIKTPKIVLDTYGRTTSASDISTTLNFSGLASSSHTHTSLSTVSVGSATRPVYFNSSGVPTATTYSLGKTVPSTAVFTDTNVLQQVFDLTTEGTYPLLFSTSNTSSTTNSTSSVYRNNSIYVDPINNALYSSKIITTGNATIGGALTVNNNITLGEDEVKANKFTGGLSYLSTPPTSENTNGVQIVLLNSTNYPVATTTKYSGYLYFWYD